MREFFFFFFFRVIKMTLKKKKKSLEKYILKPLFDWKHFLGQIFFFSKTDLIIYICINIEEVVVLATKWAHLHYEQKTTSRE